MHLEDYINVQEHRQSNYGKVVLDIHFSSSITQKQAGWTGQFFKNP